MNHRLMHSSSPRLCASPERVVQVLGQRLQLSLTSSAGHILFLPAISPKTRLIRGVRACYSSMTLGDQRQVSSFGLNRTGRNSERHAHSPACVDFGLCGPVMG